MNRFYGSGAGPSPGTPLFRTKDPFLNVVLRRPANAPASEGAKQHLLATALIDTGASRSCIDKSIVERLHLLRTGEDELVGVGGSVNANVYQVFVDVPSLGGYRREMELYSPQDHSIPSMVLLGRDFLSDFVFVYEGSEECFSFFRTGQHPDDMFDGDDG